jgi:hypothetical protein
MVPPMTKPRYGEELADASAGAWTLELRCRGHLASGYDNALALVARLNGYTASLGNTPAVTVDAAAA